jgi:hypothetical protein
MLIAKQEHIMADDKLINILEVQRVIALRAMKIAVGGSSARSEVSRMVTEKVSAEAEAVAILTRGGSGRRVIRRYRTRVRANVRRLSRSARVSLA